jgi:predicted DNA-binding transcriptional regulator AlpA
MIDLDPYLRSAQVAQARGCSTSWLYELIQRGDFPPPDRPAQSRGEANLWRASTVRDALDRMQTRRAAA